MKILPIAITLVGLSLTGCGNNNESNNTTMVESTTKSSISNNINGVFDGYRYNTDDYNLESTTYDKNSNSRFGDGMKGAENIKGNENKSTKNKIKSDINNIYNDDEYMYNNIKNDIKNSMKN